MSLTPVLLRSQLSAIPVARLWLIVGLLLLVMSSGAYALEKVSIYPKYMHKAQFAGIYMAKYKGFFTNQGLDVTILDYDPATDSIDAIKTDLAEYTIQDPVILTEVEAGLDFVVVAAYAQQSLWSLTFKGNFEGVNDLLGQPIAVAQGASEAIAYRLAAEYGLNKQDIVVYADAQEFLQLLKQDKLAAVVGYRSNEEYYFRQYHAAAKSINPMIIGHERVGQQFRPVGLYGDILVASRAEAENNPARVLKVIDAINAGWQYAFEHPQQALDIMRKTYPQILDNFSLQQMQLEMEVMADSVAPDYVNIGTQSMARWQLIANYYDTHGMLVADDLDLEHYVWSRQKLIHKATDKDQEWLTHILYLLLLLVVIAIAILLFSRALLIEKVQQILMSQRISKGLKRREFIFYFQPLMDADETLIGYEALVRWQHPKLGFLAPDDFIAVIERSAQLSLALDRYAIGTVMHMLAALPAACSRKKVAINVSYYFFTEHDFMQYLLELQKSTGLPLSWIELEMTERLEPDSLNIIANAIESLREAGVGVSLDDYGTGYTSLNILNAAQFGKLKVDRTLINDINISAKARATCQCIFLLALHHNMTVVCEGVESSQQVDMLKNLMKKCINSDDILHSVDLQFQGYYFGQPQAEFLS